MSDQGELNRSSWEQAHLRRRASRGGQTLDRSPLPAYVWDTLACTSGDKLLQCLCGDGADLIAIVDSVSGTSGLGIDFSPSVVETAMKLALKRRVECRFWCSDVGDALAALAPRSFTIAFNTLGSLWWIQDLQHYFAALRRVVEHRFLIWDFHPMIYAMDEQLEATGHYPFAAEVVRHESGIEDYWIAAGSNERGTTGLPVTEYRWPLSTILSSAIASGWRLQRFDEFAEVYGERYSDSLADDGRGNFHRRGATQLPLTMLILFE